jgi:hypothetical protein
MTPRTIRLGSMGAARALTVASIAALMVLAACGDRNAPAKAASVVDTSSIGAGGSSPVNAPEDAAVNEVAAAANAAAADASSTSPLVDDGSASASNSLAGDGSASPNSPRAGDGSPGAPTDFQSGR